MDPTIRAVILRCRTRSLSRHGGSRRNFSGTSGDCAHRVITPLTLNRTTRPIASMTGERTNVSKKSINSGGEDFLAEPSPNDKILSHVT